MKVASKCSRTLLIVWYSVVILAAAGAVPHRPTQAAGHKTDRSKQNTKRGSA